MTYDFISAEFELVDQYGRNVTKQQEGLLLYNGGTVCDDQFDEDSARAICRALGRPSQQSTWKSYPVGPQYGQFQSRKTIKLGMKGCLNNDGMWFFCSFTTKPQCKHEEDVFLTCSDGKRIFSMFCVDLLSMGMSLHIKMSFF